MSDICENQQCDNKAKHKLGLIAHVRFQGMEKINPVAIELWFCEKCYEKLTKPDEVSLGYDPDYVVHPRGTVFECLHNNGLEADWLIEEHGVDPYADITEQSAALFEKLFNVPASFWLTKQKRYDEGIKAGKPELD